MPYILLIRRIWISYVCCCVHFVRSIVTLLAPLKAVVDRSPLWRDVWVEEVQLSQNHSLILINQQLSGY